MNRLVVFSTVGALAASVLGYVLWTKSPDSLHADLELVFTCNAAQRPPSVPQVEYLMTMQSFRINNLEAARNANKRQFNEMEIVGIGPRSEIMRIIAPLKSSTYTFTLHTRPPTKRNHLVEIAMENFVRDELQCKLIKTQRGDNPDNAQKLFDRLVRDQENLLEENKKKGGVEN